MPHKWSNRRPRLSRHYFNRVSSYPDDYTRMVFGKYKGTRLDEVPTEYLEWAANQADCPDLTARDFMRHELTKRKTRFNKQS